MNQINTQYECACVHESRKFSCAEYCSVSILNFTAICILSIVAEYKDTHPFAAEYKGNACKRQSSFVSMLFNNDTNFKTVEYG